MLIAISGSQGSGKTTVLQKLKESGEQVISRKTSRSILTDWGVTLQDVNNDPELVMKFQDEILTRKNYDEELAVTSDEIVFTERTYADLFTYALISLGSDNKYSDFLNQYYIRCMEFQQQYSLIYYLRAGHFTVVPDGVRGANSHYSRMVDVVMLDITRQLTRTGILNEIDTPILQQRVAKIKAQSRLMNF